MDIVYLDQNKWIELARVHAGATATGPAFELYPQLLEAVREFRVLFPLSSAHVLETSKRNDPVSRGALAETQAALSRGHAYRSRASRLSVEIRSILLRLFGREQPPRPELWAIAESFLEAFEPMDALVAPPAEVSRVAKINAAIDPAVLYLDFMKNQDDSRRRMAHGALTAGLSDLVARIELRRARWSGQTLPVRRRAHAALLFIEHQETILRIAGELGYSFEELSNLGDKALRALVFDVPTLDVEAAMAAKLEAETGPIEPNDVLDIQSFYTAIPYSGRIVAEKAAIARARQAKLDEKYNVELSCSLNDLLDVYVTQ